MGKAKVWAPYANKVELCIANARLAMVKNSENNWWQIETEKAQPNIDYTFVLDDGKSLPDPRSLWQPNGVFGASRFLDHNEFIWHDQNWQAPPLSSAIIYELHIGTFSQEGTFDGAITHLHYLKSLGITHIEIMPVHGFSGARGWGYDNVNLFAPHEAYGGPHGLKRLVEACHQHGLAVILDVVYNHIGPEGNILPLFGPYFTDRYKTPWGNAINFDGEYSYEVRRFFCDNAKMWLEHYHIDALRLDAVHAIYDTSAISILEQLAIETKILQATLKRHFYLISECNLNDPRQLQAWNPNTYGIDAQWNDDFHHALHAILTGEKAAYYSDYGSLANLAKAFTKAFVFDGCYSNFRKLNYGKPIANLSGHNFVSFLQNHDQIGNRAKGERISQIVNSRLLQVGATLLFLSPFIPLIFQGEEWGALTPFQFFTDFQDPNLGETVKNGRTNELAQLGWQTDEVPSPQDIATFNNSKLSWQDLDHPQHQEILRWYKKLISLRNQISDLTNGLLENITIKYDEEARWFMFKRGNIIAITNFGKDKQMVADKEFQSKNILLSSDPQNTINNNNEIHLHGESVIVLN